MKKTAIVTGASGNLGKAIVEKLLEANFRVLGTFSPHHSTSDHESHPNFEKYTLDVSDQKAMKDMIHYIMHKWGDIHFSALLVGGFEMKAFEETTLDDFYKMIHLNFDTAFVSAQAIYQQMKQQSTGGKMMFVGAKPAIEKGASEGMIAYALSKSLVVKLAEHINLEGAEYQVQASVVVPGIIDTPQNRRAMPDANFSEWVTPEQIAEVSLFLANQPPALLQDVVLKVYGVA